MAVGDIKGESAIVRNLEAGATVAIGDVVQIKADNKFDPAGSAATVGKYAVAITDATDGNMFRGVIWGMVEVTATAVAIGAHQIVQSGASGTIALSAGTNPVVGTTMDDFDAGGTGTLFVGLVG